MRTNIQCAVTFRFIIFVLFLFVRINATSDLDEIIIQEVNEGHTIELHCHSIDKNHNFMFWELATGNTVVGPGNNFDEKKYNYQILTGLLFIQNVTPEEGGFYRCVSRGVRNDDLKIRTVDLVVIRNWEEVFESDTDTNLLRLILVFTVLLILMGVIAVILKVKEKFPRPYLEKDSNLLLNNNSDFSDEDSTEEVFSAPSTSKMTNVLLNTTETTDNIENTGTDFQAVYAALHTPKN